MSLLGPKVAGEAETGAPGRAGEPSPEVSGSGTAEHGDDIAEHLRFAGIDDEVRALLREIRPIVTAELPGILDGFYSHIRTFPDAAHLFPSAMVIAHAREMQIAHWALITDGTFDSQYAESVRRIGEVHYRLGLEPRSYIGGYSFIITRLITRVHLIERGWRIGRENRKWKTATALNRAALLDMDLAISVYLEAARRNRRETLDRLAANFEQVVATVVRSVSSAANDLQSSTGLLAASSSETMHQADAASEASMEATRNIETVAWATDQLAASLNEIGSQIATSSLIATRAVTEAEQITSQVGGLTGSVDRIDGIVDVIRAIADKTKLLALNASIEASRAGETGRGFSVVAAEVKLLAVQTASATAEIDSQIGTIRDFTQYVAAAVGAIRQTIREMNDIGSVVASAIQGQENATQQTARNVQQAWQRSAEVANNIVGVTRLASDSSAASARALSATTDLARQIEKLTSEAEEFLSRVGVS